MNTREQLNTYLRALEKRLRWMAISKGAAVVAGVALGATLALVLIVNGYAFSETSMVWARVALFLALGLALGYALVIPLTRLNSKRAATRAERAFPEFQERLLTYVERADSGDPMLELLAADTEAVAQKTEPKNVAPQKSIFAFATGTGAASAALIWMILAGPGFLGYGAKLLWAGAPKSGNETAFYDIQVQPGNKRVRRKDDVPVSATLIGFQAERVRLFARYQSSSKWEQAIMLPRDNGSAYEFRFAALPEPVEYYVEAGSVKSKTYKLDVADLAGITHIKTTYHFPSWLGLPDQVEDPSGDLRAVTGTVAEVLVTTDRPLKNGVIEMEDGSRIPLDAGANGLLTAKVPIQRSGLYHFAAMDQGQSVRLSPLDYFIEAQDDQPPSVRITHPGGDARVLPIEEVSIDVTAQDDFALQGMDLHYSVNGGPEKVMPLLANKGVKTADAQATLALEDFKLQPGDVVSMYATAKDARNTAQTDILFVEAQAYERNYTQSQQMGGGGGGGGGGAGQQAQEIWDRQKEVITATYNATRPNDKTKTRENADYLSTTELTLKAQAESLSQRMTSRQLDGNVATAFQTVIDELKAAGTDMSTASDKLKGQGWSAALPPENSALRHLDHVQAAEKDIQVAFGNGGGGGGGGANAGRDLQNLFDLELDTEKNQYEQQTQGGNSQEEQQKKIDDAMAKLDELAKREQELAQQPRNPENAAEQRYQQEQLQKQAQELQRQLQQMQQQAGQRGQQGSQSQGGQQSSSSQGGQSGSQQGSQQANGQPGSQQQRASAQNLQNGRTNGANAQQLQQTLDRLQKQLQQSIDAMKQSNQAAAQGQQGEAAAQAEARRAAQSLGDAGQMLRGLQQQDAAGKLNDLVQRANELSQQQHAEEDKVKQQFGDTQSRDRALADRGNQAYNNFQRGDRATRQEAEQIAKEEEDIASKLNGLQDDIQRQEQSLRAPQPNAAARLRDGLAETRQSDAERRLQNLANFARNGYGPMMASSETPITSSIDAMRDDLQKAQQSMQSGNNQGGVRDQQERSLAEIEREVQTLQSMVDQLGRGNQPGNRQGGQQPGQQPGNGQQKGGQGQQGGGQQGGGQQGGGQQAGGGQQGGVQPGGNNARAGGGGNNYGGAYAAGPNGGYFGPNGGAYVNPALGANRNYPQGVYDAPENRAANPGMVERELQSTLQDLRQTYKDDPNALRSIGDLEKGLEQVRFGDTASPELADRIDRVILPEWESFEVQLRRELEASGAGQAKATTPDKVPPGYDANVEEYTRKLSTGSVAK